MRKKILAVVLIIMFILVYFKTYATTISEYQSQKKETEAAREESR